MASKSWSDKRKVFFYSRNDGTGKKLENYTIDELRGINLYYDEPWTKIRNLRKDQLVTNIRGLKGYQENIEPRTVIIKEQTIEEKILGRKTSLTMDTEWYANELFQELENYGVQATSSSEVPPGKLCFFSYSAKWAERYPYWDRTPLAYILDQKEDRMLGANLHYLSDSLRNIYVRKVLNKDNEIFGAMPAKTLHTYIHSNIANVYIIPEDMQEYIGIAQLPTWDFISGDGINYADVRAIWDVPLNGKY